MDSGITDHSLLPNVLPGYNFYQLLGSTRSANHYDTGDWVTQAESYTQAYQDLHCGAKNSDWHGTAMAACSALILQFGRGFPQIDTDFECPCSPIVFTKTVSVKPRAMA